ncbi:MAG: MotA/TolQ/ExbB proton channel family protein [Opitutales bacterium]
MEETFIEAFIRIWNGGGSLMIPLAALAAFTYYTGFELYFHFGSGNYLKVKYDEVVDWIYTPSKAKGEVGEIINYCFDGSTSLADIQNRYAEVRAAHIPRVDRRIVFLGVLISIAPLMGLLGTVMGMLETFDGLTRNVGRTIDLIAGGISEALITTQTGLMIAIPGYIIVYMVVRRRNKLDAFITRMESVSMQRMDESLKAAQ